MTKGRTLRRLLVSFLPHSPLFLATLLATTLYAASMTARMATMYPLMRMFGDVVAVETTGPAEPGAEGPQEKVFKRVLTADDGDFSPALATVNRFFDKIETWWIEHLEWAIPAKVYKRVDARAQIGTIASTLSMFAIMMVMAAVAGFLTHILRELLVVRVLVTLRVKLLQNLLSQPLAFYNERKRGELISRMGADVQSATMCLSTLTGPMIQCTLKFLIPVAAVVLIKWWFGFVVLAFMLFFSLSLRKQSRKVHRRARVRQRTTARVTEAMVQMFSGIRVVKAFGLEGEKVAQYTARNREFTRDTMATEVAKARTRTRMELLTHSALIAVVGAIGIIVATGAKVPAGVALATLFFMAEMYRPTKQLTNAYTDLQDHLAGAGRTFEFMDLKPALTDRPHATRLVDPVGTVRFEDVSFSYSNSTKGNGNGKVLHHVNLEVPAGEVVALVGHSGAGKSTLVNLVPRFYDPDDGRITIDGTDIREFTRQSLLDHMAIVTQEPFLFNSSIRENIAYGKPGATREEIEAAARAANAHDFISELARGYETIVGERGANLSGGQGQRVTIARALIRDARILILDEATSNLDTESERAVQDALQNLMKGRTTLVIAHRLSTVQYADKICVMQDGRICEVGTHTQLMASETLYRRLYQLQFAN